ncbi:hypothetical protein HK102_012754, partial [Quaeritorhiza haematococci]
MNYDLTKAEAPLLDAANLLHCSSWSDTVIPDGISEYIGWDPDWNALTTFATLKQYGEVASEVFNFLPGRNRLVMLYERTDECQEMTTGFTSYIQGQSLMAKLSTPPTDPNDRSYREWDVWREQIREPEVDIGETEYAAFAEYLAGSLVIDSSGPHRFYSESESDRYYQLQTMRHASAIIPAMSELVSQGKISWEEVSRGMLLQKVNKFRLVEALNNLQLPGRVDESRAFDRDGYQILPVNVYFSNKKEFLKDGHYSQSLSLVGTLTNPYANWWELKDRSPTEFQEQIAAERGVITTVKIGFMWPAKPSFDQYVEFGGVDINQQLLPLQALVDYWNTHHEYYPQNIKLELVYGSHGMDVRNATLEAGRLALEEKVTFLIGDINLELSTAVYNVINVLNMFQCSSTSDVAFLRGDPNDPAFITAQGSISDPGAVSGSVLSNPQLSRAVVLHEDTLECQSMI